MRRLITTFLFAFPLLALAQQSVTIQVDGAKQAGAFPTSWNYFGYDEPNYTYMKNGRKLIGELAALSRTPAHIRTHFLLVTGTARRPSSGVRRTPIRKMPPASPSTTGPSSTRSSAPM